jgi:hypothetical protein
MQTKGRQNRYRGNKQWELKDQQSRVRSFAKSRSARLGWEQENLQPE